MKALYRRYRPKTLEEVVAEKQVTEPLITSLKKKQIGHAYLFVGPRGCGKTSVARILAHQINDFKYELEDNYLDIIEIDAASNTGVDNIRELRERAIVAPVEGEYKVYIIDEVHMLSKSAFNALLKTLEEPPEHVVFIMATTDFEKVPATIVSRCQTFQFKLADESEMLDHLKKICKSEKIDIEDEALSIIINRGGGSFRDTLSLLDQISTISSKKISAESVREILGMPSQEAVEILLEAYGSQDLDTIRKQIVELKKNNVDVNLIAEQMINRIISKMDLRLLPIVEKLMEVSKSNYPEVKLLSILATPSIAAPTVPATNSRNSSGPSISRAENIKTASVSATPAKPQVESKIAAPKPEEKKETPEPTVTKTKPAETAKVDTEPATQVAEAPVVTRDFNNEDELWSAIMENIREKACSIQSQLNDSNYQLIGNVLTIYTGNAFYKKQIEKKRGIIAEVCPQYEVVISDDCLRSDKTLEDIAELMGGGEEVAFSE